MNWMMGLLLGGLTAHELGKASDRFAQRRTVYGAAQVMAKAQRKPLLVVGDPDAGIHTSMARAYGCGDLCLDLHGCPACDAHERHDVTQPLPFPPGSMVVFEACVLEYVDEPFVALANLLEVAGSAAHYFGVRVQPNTFAASLHPGAKWAFEADGRVRSVDPDKAVHGALLGYGLLSLVRSL